MVFGRSSYLAAAMPNSGGITGNYTFKMPACPLCAAHTADRGMSSSSAFPMATATMNTALRAKGRLRRQLRSRRLALRESPAVGPHCGEFSSTVRCEP